MSSGNNETDNSLLVIYRVPPDYTKESLIKILLADSLSDSWKSHVYGLEPPFPLTFYIFDMFHTFFCVATYIVYHFIGFDILVIDKGFLVQKDKVW